ncbi:uncharacterized protein Triagg1_5970 [Trichoderma aggressivum f. europaeum]|uniref:Protein kinase domain-containing protein n=1 Tax=Trichoderma aggressivum f. europaeum TaxID=173218 RepID=A0AAE1IDX4_9HYPO|nr:hypothetical protein Triagg1_5970 [Trichoderma aggressivum f. europaeum]
MTSQEASLSSDIAKLFAKDVVLPGDVKSCLDKLNKHYQDEYGDDGDDGDNGVVLDAFATRQVMCLIMGCLKDATAMKEWLKTNHRNKTMYDRNLPVPLGKVEGLSSTDEQEKFNDLQRKLCWPYEMGEHSDVVSPMLSPFYTCNGPVGKGAYAIVEPVERVHHVGEKKIIRYARKRSLAGKSETALNELKTFTNMGSHHHVVQLVGSYSYNGDMNIILSPLADHNLSEYLEADMNPRKEKALKRSFGCLLSGLGFLSVKIRHKDIKPQNILIDGSRILFTDFGSAYMFEKGLAETFRTLPGLINPMYAAPEVFISNERRDVKTDLFSLGCVFAEIIAVLSGMTITEFYEEIKGVDGESRGIQYSDKVDELHKWLDTVKATRPDLSTPIDWCKKMTKHDLAERPKITTLIQDARKQCMSNGESEAYFCVDCLSKPAGGTLDLVTEEEDVRGEDNIISDTEKVNKKDDYGVTRLSAAASQGDEKRAKKLLDAGADPNIKDPNEAGTSLHWAAEGGDPNTIRHILKKGNVKINDQSRFHGTPLCWAVQKRFLAAAAVLLEFNANVDLKNQTGLTPLHLAAQNGDADMVKLLLDHNASTTETDKRGRTALNLAQESGEEEVVALLRDASHVPVDEDQGQTTTSMPYRLAQEPNY